MTELRPLSRRTLLLGSGMAVAWLGAGAPALAGTTEDLALIRERRRHPLVGDGTSGNDPDLARLVTGQDTEAKRLRTTMNRAPTRSFVWSDLASTTDPSHHRISYDRLRTMASAYSTPGSSLHRDSSLAADLVEALDWLYANRFNPALPKAGNWWEWEIGTPLRLNDICVLLRDLLGTDRISRYMAAVLHFAPTVGNVGANLVWSCLVATLHGANSDNATRLALVRDRIGQLFPYVTDGDGFYADGSFIQHQDFAYTGGYGTSLLVYLADLLSLVAGTPWESTHPDRDNVFAWIYEAFDPLLYRGAIMDMVRGREISRYYQTDRTAGHLVLSAVLSLAQFAPDASALRSLVKGHLLADDQRDFFAYDRTATERVRVGTAALAKAALAGQTPARGELVAHRQFPAMDRAVHRRDGFAIGISMSSRRTQTFEMINNENGRAWYTAEGMVYLYNDDLAHYTDQFWSTVDWYRLPGTTVDTRSRTNFRTYRPPTSWVGGAVLDDTYGAVGMDLDADAVTLVAHKSWFCLDDQVVCLGAGITSTDGRRIETIVENRKFNEGTQPAIIVDGRPLTLADGVETALVVMRWMHLEGVGGYVFPTPTQIRIRRETRTGRWTDINSGANSDATPYTRSYVTAWIDHGTNPNQATYAYALVPGASPEDLRRYAATTTQILSNIADIQAVAVRALGLTMMNAWASTGGSAGGITTDAPASIVARASGSQLAVAVSDPTQLNTGAITVEIDSSARRLATADARVSVVRLAPTIRIQVDVADAVGRTVTARFDL